MKNILGESESMEGLEEIYSAGGEPIMEEHYRILKRRRKKMFMLN